MPHTVWGVTNVGTQGQVRFSRQYGALTGSGGVMATTGGAAGSCVVFYFLWKYLSCVWHGARQSRTLCCLHLRRPPLMFVAFFGVLSIKDVRKIPFVVQIVVERWLLYVTAENARQRVCHAFSDLCRAPANGRPPVVLLAILAIPFRIL
jgi:hypothetical protein